MCTFTLGYAQFITLSFDFMGMPTTTCNDTNRASYVRIQKPLSFCNQAFKCKSIGAIDYI